MKAITNFVRSLKGKLSGMRTSLTRINEKEPLSKLSLIVIIFLDIFILSTLFNGLEEHTDQLTTPDEYIPAICRDMVIQDDGERSEKLNRLASTALHYHRNPIEDQKRRNLHPICMRFRDTIEPVIENSEIMHLFEMREKLNQKYTTTEDELKQLTSSYDTFLLEKISGEAKQEKSNISAIKLNLTQKREKLIEKRIAKGCCLHCGKKIPPNAQACPFCGFKQYSTCSSCGEETFIYGRFCKECGAESEQI